MSEEDHSPISIWEAIDERLKALKDNSPEEKAARCKSLFDSKLLVEVEPYGIHSSADSEKLRALQNCPNPTVRYVKGKGFEVVDDQEDSSSTSEA